MDLNNLLSDLTIPKDLRFTMIFSSTVNAVVSSAYSILSIFAILYYCNCNVGPTETNSKELWSIIYRVYLQDANCHNNSAFFQSIPPGLTQARTVFVLNMVLLSFTVINVIASVALFSKVHSANTLKNLKIFVYLYLCAWASALVLDLSVAKLFGEDIIHLGKLMDLNETYDFYKESLRVGAFLLMSVSMKGLVIPVINLVVITVMITHLWQHNRNVNRRTRSMQRLLCAYARFGPNNSDIDSSPSPPSVLDNRNSTGAAPYEQASSPQTRVHTPMQTYGRPFTYLVVEERPSPMQVVVQSTNKKPHVPPPPPVPAQDDSPVTRVKNILQLF